MDAQAPNGFSQSSFKYSPLRHIRTLFVRFVQGLFSAAPPGGGYHWDPDDEVSEIYITSSSHVDGQHVNVRPAISFTRGPIQFQSIGQNDLYSYDFATGKTTKSIIIPGTMVINCVSRVELECEDISFITGEHLWLLRDMLMKRGFFDVARSIQIGAPSAAGSIVVNDAGDEYTVVSISVPFQIPRTSSFTPLSQIAVQNIRQSLNVSTDTRFFSQGVPTGVNEHECQPESFAPLATDTRGHSPDPSRTGPRGISRQPHPLDPAKSVFVRNVFGNRPGQTSAHQGPSVPIQDPCVEESP